MLEITDTAVSYNRQLKSWSTQKFGFLEIEWVRVIYDGAGNFQVFFGIFMAKITRALL